LPLVEGLIEEGVGEDEGGVGFVDVEVDAVLMGGGMGAAVDYGVSLSSCSRRGWEGGLGDG
jgi:hypothetical protein